ncbi:hypothetical protein I541_1063 [Mycobacteroides abscessus]|nr:hypothetical protein I541_1063 [Mycobacteroides abscessus]
MMDYDLGLEIHPKRRENTYRDEALDDWAQGHRSTVVAYYGDRLIRYTYADGWGDWEQIA